MILIYQESACNCAGPCFVSSIKKPRSVLAQSLCTGCLFIDGKSNNDSLLNKLLLHISSLFISEGPPPNRAPIKPLLPQGWGSFIGT